MVIAVDAPASLAANGRSSDSYDLPLLPGLATRRLGAQLRRLARHFRDARHLQDGQSDEQSAEVASHRFRLM